MVTRTGGSRRKSRYKFKKHYRRRGKISLSKFFQEFSNGDKVALVAEPAYQKAIYHARFHGNIGTISGNQGRVYKVEILDGRKQKQLLIHPVHLKKV
jgi:large subunit ribosomal protein L21e